MRSRKANQSTAMFDTLILNLTFTILGVPQVRGRRRTWYRVSHKYEAIGELGCLAQYGDVWRVRAKTKALQLHAMEALGERVRAVANNMFQFQALPFFYIGRAVRRCWHFNMIRGGVFFSLIPVFCSTCISFNTALPYFGNTASRCHVDVKHCIALTFY
jgi:hypothetical protein